MPIQSDKELLHSSVSKYLPIIFIKNLKFGQIRVEKKVELYFFMSYYMLIIFIEG